MKKITLLVFLLLSSVFLLYSQDIAIGNFLENYFETKNYTQENYVISDQDVVFAYRTKDNKLGIFDKGIMFTIENNHSIKPLVYFLESSISNSDEVLFAGKIQSQKFFGWSIKVFEKNASFSTKFYTDDGAYVTEGPIFIWDNSKSKFKQYVIDKTMM